MSTVATTDPVLTSKSSTRTSIRGRLQDALPKIVLAPSFLITVIFVYGFIVWTAYLSFTNSKTFPSYALTGSRAYQRLWRWTPGALFPVVKLNIRVDSVGNVGLLQFAGHKRGKRHLRCGWGEVI